MKSTQALHEAGQSLWLDNITRALLDGGILARVDTSALASELQRQGADAFVASWQYLLDRIGARHEQLSR